ncbi:LysR family transcriptional regulator [Paraherbaspirillum soli]|uniref:LysR family transcriptional regulator n=1 Tax=Paraherbaspirillum soli TaxID=631222 RepID=A0ABW0MCY3_9BURK
MEFTEITAFVQAAELQSFTAAAHRLGLTPSGISKSIARLEQELGVRLLNRTTRQLSLTADGSLFLGRCTQLLADFEEMRSLLQPSKAEPAGTLRVSLPVSFGRMVVMPVLTRLCQQHPKLHIEVSFTDRKIDLVEEGIDATVRIGVLPDTQLIARRISTARMLVCASPEYLQRAGRPTHSAELVRHQCVGYRSSNSSRVRNWEILEPDGSKASVLPPVRLTVDNGEALVQAALDGVGLVSLHSYMAADLVRGGRLQVLFAPDPDEDEPIHVLYPSSRHLSPKVRALVDLLAEAVPKSF